MNNVRRWAMLVVFIFVFLIAGQFDATTYGQGTSPRNLSTTLEVRIVTVQLQSALKSQEWGRAFQKIGYRIRIRRAASTDKPDVTETIRGDSRRVTAIGVLDRTGTLEFPGGRKFKLADSAKLKEWLDSLKKYGAQGAPEGKPLWGLNADQFASVYNSLSQKLDDELFDVDVQTAIARVKAPKRHRLFFSPSARLWLRKQPGSKVRQKVKGISIGTALALVLKDSGLGFYPTRTASGSIDLAIKPLAESKERPWPVGWEPRLSRTRTAPLLFKLFPVNLEEMGIVELSDVVSEKTEVPILFDYSTIAAADIDIDELTVTIPERKSTLYRAVQTAVSRNRLSLRLLIDELGKPLVYVTTAAAAREKAIKSPTAPK